MEDIRSYIIMCVGAVFTLLAPIENFMYAMLLLFSVNFIFGIVAARVNKEPWDMKKALKFFLYCGVFFGVSAVLFLIGYCMDEKEQATAVVKILCFAAVYIFGTNIFRNWLNIITPGGVWYKFVDLCYYVLSIQFIERFPRVKKWQEERNNTDQEGKTILDQEK